MTRTVLVLLLAAPLLAAPVPKALKANPPDAQAIQGTWRMVTNTSGGAPSDCKNVAWRFEADGKLFCVHTDTGREFPMRYALDPTGDPKQMDWRPNPNDKPHPGIYKLAGDTLTVVQPTSAGDTRPADFSSARGVYFIEFQRDPPVK